MSRSSSVDDVSLSLPFVPPLPLANETTIPHTDSVTINRTARPIIIHPPVVCVEDCRGRSRSRSRSSRSRSSTPSPHRLPTIIYPTRRCGRGSGSSRSPSIRSRSPSPRRYARRPRSYSPGPPYIPRPSRSPSPCPIPIIPPGPTIIAPPPPRICVVPGPMSPPSPSQWCVRPPSGIWSTQVPKPVDILTFHYNKNMAYAPAAKTYDVRRLSLLFTSCLRACVI
jgi:hypothetical protein